MNNLLLTIITFFKNNLLLFLAAAMGLFFIVILLLSFLLPSSNTTTLQTPTPTTQIPNPARITPTITPLINQEQTAKESGVINFSEDSEIAIEGKKENLGDGTIKYTFASLNPNRSDILITKNGSVIFTRHAVVGKEISDGYKNLLGKQDATLPGPTFYGTNTLIFFYTAGGTALIVDPKTNTTYEEFSFQPPITLAEFINKYKIYTL